MQAFWRINYHNKRYKDLKIYGDGEIHFRVITADTGTSGMVTGM